MRRVEDQATGEPSENNRSRSPKCGVEPDHADKRNTQPSAEDINASHGTIGGGEGAKTYGHAEINAELAGICGAASEIANQTFYQPRTGDVHAADTPTGEEGANHDGSDAEIAESEEGTTGFDIGGTGTIGEITDKAEETGGYSLTYNVGLDKPAKEKMIEWEVAGFGEKGGREPDSAEEGETSQTRGVEGVGQAEDQITLPLSYAGDADGGIAGSERLVGGTESAGEVVVFVENSVQQIDMGTEREADNKLGEIVRADTVVEQGEEIQPLAIMGAGECQTEAWDGVLERILAFCQELGSECDGHEEELMAIFTAIEANRNNKKGGKANRKGDKVGNRSNRELKRLENTVKYDVKGSAIVSGKGRNGKFC
jgi:hypothetical protein